MPQVEIEVNGRPYKLACQAGEEERIIQLGRYIDRRFRDLAGGGGGTDLHMMVVTCLMLADELFDAQSGVGLATARDAEAIDRLTGRIEAIAALLARR